MTLGGIRWLWRAGIAGLGGALTVVACLQQSVGADGLNYLTLGTAYWERDWSLAINGIWSPLYGVVAAGVLKLLAPPISLTFPVVQGVNFVIFLFSLLTFERLWTELRETYARNSGGGTDTVILSAAVWWSVGYALFLWAGLVLVEIWSVTPDMLVAALVYLAAAHMVRIARGDGTPFTYAALGVTLGFGYLAKAPLFPLGIAALGITAALHHGRLGRASATGATLRTAVAAGAFALVVSPFSISLSLKEGHPTFSEVSRFTYLKHVNRIPFPRWREGVVQGVGSPAHPPRLVHTDPEVYAFPGPVGGAYPPSFDPDYFTEGLTPDVNLFQQVNEIANSGAFYFRLFFREGGPFLGVFALAALFALRAGVRPRLPEGAWYLTAWAACAFAMYSLVFVTERYVASFVVLFWAGLLGYLRFPPGRTAQRLSQGAGILLAGAALTSVLALNLAGAMGVLGFRAPVESRPTQFTDGPSASPASVAVSLVEMGVAPGVDVAHIGHSYTAFWAYLNGVRIVAEIWLEEADKFWEAPAATQAEILDLFREAGARYVVAAIPGDPAARDAGWEPVGGTGYLLLRLD